MSPLQYLIELRLRTALKLLETTTLSVKEIMHKVGVSDQSYFTRLIRKYCRLSPREYRQLARSGPGQSDSRIVQETAELSILSAAG
jgi:AraC-like DNA-binding protein